jgi:hypothetical protein
MGLTFDALPHTYALDGVDVPSVTGVLKACGLIDFSGIPRLILEAARLRGTTVHEAVHYYNEGDLNVAWFCDEFPGYAGYLQAWVAFRRQRRFVPILNEHRIASRRHQVAGTLDCLGVLDGEAVLLDYATGRPRDVAKHLQTAAYHALALEWASEDAALAAFFARYPVVRRCAIALRKDGSFRLEPYGNPADFRTFRTYLEDSRTRWIA